MSHHPMKHKLYRFNDFIKDRDRTHSENPENFCRNLRTFTDPRFCLQMWEFLDSSNWNALSSYYHAFYLRMVEKQDKKEKNDRWNQDHPDELQRYLKRAEEARLPDYKTYVLEHKTDDERIRQLAFEVLVQNGEWREAVDLCRDIPSAARQVARELKKYGKIAEAREHLFTVVKKELLSGEKPDRKKWEYLRSIADEKLNSKLDRIVAGLARDEKKYGTANELLYVDQRYDLLMKRIEEGKISDGPVSEPIEKAKYNAVHLHYRKLQNVFPERCTAITGKSYFWNKDQ